MTNTARLNEQPGGCVRGAAVMLAALVWVFVCGAASGGEIVIESGRFGFSNTVQAERHTFLRLYISSGKQAWSGQISVTVPHDNTQTAWVTTSAATTPGIAVPIELPVLLPEYWERIEIVANDGNDRQRWELRNSGASTYPTIQPPLMDQFHTVVLAVGDPSITRSFQNMQPGAGNATQDPLATILGTQYAAPDEPFQQTKSGDATPPPKDAAEADRQIDREDRQSWMNVMVESATDGLPLHWQSFDAYELVIAKENALRAETPQARAALMEWVMAGGRLLIQLDDAGQGWRTLLPKDVPLDTFTLGDSTMSTPSSELIGVASRRAGEGSSGAAAVLRPRAARSLSLTPTGRREGWRVAWGERSATSNEGLLAYGPLGFGVIGFLGVDPDGLTMADPEGTLAAARLWRDVVKRVAWANEDRALNASTSDAWWAAASGPTLATRESLRRTLDDIIVVTPLGGGIFISLFALMFALTLMLGPGDAIILKRLRLRHRSWLTALLWIGLASAGAVAIPALVRTGQSGYSLMVVDDVRMREGADPISARTGVVGIFAGAPGEYSLPEHSEGAAWRGVSPAVNMGTQLRGFAALPMTSREIAPLGCRGVEIGSVGVGQWNFRTVQYTEACGVVSGRLGAHVRSDSFGVEVTLEGVPEGATLEGAVLRMNNKFYNLKFPEGVSRVMKTSELKEVSAADVHMDAAPPSTRGMIGGGPWAPSRPGPDEVLTHAVAAGFTLHGPCERADGVGALEGTGAYATVYVKLTGMAIPGVGGDSAKLTTQHVWLSRIVAPIEGDKR